MFDLATGTERAWSARTCAECVPGGGGIRRFVDTEALSWTADSQHVAFIWWSHAVRLLDYRAAGSDILTDSKTVATWTGVTGLEPVARGHHHPGRPDRARHRGTQPAGTATARSASTWSAGPLPPPATRPPS